MRPDPNHPPLEPETPADRLDRLWLATRPSAPSAALLDTLWASAARDLDRIEASRSAGVARRETLTFPNRRRRLIWTGIALAQAAVILIGVGIALTRRGNPEPAPGPVVMEHPPATVEVAPVASAETSPRQSVTGLAVLLTVGVESHETLMIRYDDDGPEIKRVTNPVISSTLPEGTPHDVFNALESMASL